ncbi:hypothetical protein AaE_010220, partial [Aphanomyces astaci]
MVLSLDDVSALLVLAKTRKQRRLVATLLACTYIERPLIPAVRFHLTACTDANSIMDFRFDVDGVQKVGLLLGLPSVVITNSRNRVCRDEAMCIMLSRLAFPTRFYQMAKMFGRSDAVLCDIFLFVVNDIYDRWHDLLYFNLRLVRKQLDQYCAAIKKRGAPLDSVFGFIDGTKVAVSRISSSGSGDNLQRQVYSGHKRLHCLNYQAVTAPDGVCIHFFGPVEGRKHDTTMLRHSGLLEFFLQHRDLFLNKFIY